MSSRFSMEEMRAREMVNNASGSGDGLVEECEKLSIVIHESTKPNSHSTVGGSGWREELEKVEEDIKAAAGRSANTNRHPNPCIQPIPIMLRENEKIKKYYAPRVISVGPIHHRNAKFAVTKPIKLKLAALFMIEHKIQKSNLHRQIETRMQPLKNRYFKEALNNFNDQDLTVMFLVDGCAILHYIDYFANGRIKELDIKTDQVVFAHQDIFLLENQLPFELLQLIMDSCSDGKSRELRASIDKFVLMNISEIRGTDDDLTDRPSISELLPTHLLDLLRAQLIGDAKASHTEPTNGKQTGKKWHSLRTVSELKNAGIDMKPSEERSLNIRFSSAIIGGYVHLPTLRVDDSIEPLFVNLLAYEMCPDFDNKFEVTSYICFMDMLIDSADDVRKLRHAHVLRNNLGSDELVANLFNEIRADMVPNIHIYQQVKNDIQMHYEQKWRISISQFVSDHLSTLWADIAFVAAVLELTMSFIQTWYGVKEKK